MFQRSRHRQAIGPHLGVLVGAMGAGFGGGFDDFRQAADAAANDMDAGG
jgi:hypothetical protein